MEQRILFSNSRQVFCLSCRQDNQEDQYFVLKKLNFKTAKWNKIEPLKIDNSLLLESLFTDYKYYHYLINTSIVNHSDNQYALYASLYRVNKQILVSILIDNNKLKSIINLRSSLYHIFDKEQKIKIIGAIASQKNKCHFNIRCSSSKYLYHLYHDIQSNSLSKPYIIPNYDNLSEQHLISDGISTLYYIQSSLFMNTKHPPKFPPHPQTRCITLYKWACSSSFEIKFKINDINQFLNFNNNNLILIDSALMIIFQNDYIYKLNCINKTVENTRFQIINNDKSNTKKYQLLNLSIMEHNSKQKKLIIIKRYICCNIPDALLKLISLYYSEQILLLLLMVENKYQICKVHVDKLCNFIDTKSLVCIN